ncbi:phenylacetic acid degradation b [Pontibacter chinhatensis]|uniref:Ring-1,2-phenylacetyl-CoA epoxidase subunit PaaB n=1 Tax=Pontibacter chinhatensis TaxID=1436961 RepID=A0A1I2PDY8_9BACT|nr:phenylacetic acid degradation b [Pontibacter chinhatensis]SFG11876.1 ring-1,2-phenylacetyl-CoA epoxidase subunit PaaB [Pontibacter chinhatensis]
MSLTSLDPRVTRLNLPEGELPPAEPKPELDQFETYETFHQKKEGAAYTYVGPVHAPNEEVAFLFSKEQYSRRAACSGMWVARTSHIMVTPYVGDAENVYDVIRLEEPTERSEQREPYEIFHLKKRGKAHTHAGRVIATSYQEALQEAKQQFGDKGPIVNVWVVKSKHVLQSAEEDKDMWLTVPEKKYREATAYKVMDKITKYKEEQKSTAP